MQANQAHCLNLDSYDSCSRSHMLPPNHSIWIIQANKTIEATVACSGWIICICTLLSIPLDSNVPPFLASCLPELPVSSKICDDILLMSSRFLLEVDFLCCACCACMLLSVFVFQLIIFFGEFHFFFVKKKESLQVPRFGNFFLGRRTCTLLYSSEEAH